VFNKVLEEKLQMVFNQQNFLKIMLSRQGCAQHAT
jgi:hypothetical protein